MSREAGWRVTLNGEPAPSSLSPGELTGLAGLLAEEWAEDRLTQPTPAERDLAQWLLGGMSAVAYWTQRDAHADDPGIDEDQTVAPQQDSHIPPAPLPAAELSQPVVTFVCSACEWVYAPDGAAFESGATGCPRCEGWTWVTYLSAGGGGLGERG